MQENADDLIADIQRLVSCESPSHDLEAVGRSADAVAELGIRLLGAAPERVVIDGCTHLRWRFGTAARVLVLGHHDTVWPLGSLQAHPAEVVDGRLRGPGSFDMKAGLVMALHAVAALPDRDGVTVLVTGDEEPGSPTSRTLIEQEARGCEAALILEAAGTGGALKIARKGVSRYEVHVHGRAAHAGLEPENGVNATIELSHQVQAVAALSDPVRGTTVTPTTANGGTTSNTVPARASFSVDVRAASVAEQHRTHDAITALRPRLAGASVRVEGGINRPPLEPEASAALFARAARIAARIGLPPLQAVSVGGASDGNFTAGVGTPTLDGLGAVGGGAHAEDEHVLVAELPGRTRLLTELIADLLASPEAASAQARTAPERV
ncbi:M20 family metallopeptidase [Microbacterium arabinogalactanolyticum]|uniref:M20 family metallopeptidase n=1 Tax=Microbacterium arabinogalactanolyticum TaxID=69365 RepID=UPI0025571FDF|nr:M20 family metallopeptidase [Microbacterium arabinogalactanolyticum]GLC85246.1 glutamate carboxypeptidase [Microbacterium arabinogalactanolyticum]